MQTKSKPTSSRRGETSSRRGEASRRPVKLLEAFDVPDSDSIAHRFRFRFDEFTSHLQLGFSKVAEKAQCPFIIHDLRRTFLTRAERLSLPYVVLKKRANLSGRNDTTFGYIVVDVDRLRKPMQMITNEFLRLCNPKNHEQDTSSQ